MDLLTAALSLPPDEPSTHDSIAALVTSRLSAIPGVEHVRTRVAGDTLGIGVFTNPDPLANPEQAIRSEFARIALLLARPEAGRD